MMIGQFLEAVKPNTGIIESTTGSNYYAPPPGPAPAEPKPTAPKTMADPVPALSVLFGERVFASLLEKRLAAAQGLSFQAVILKVSTWFGSIIVKDLSSASAETGQPTSKNSEQVTCIVGSPCVGKHLLLELLSPISFHHGVNFLAAVAVAWHKRLQPSINPKRILEASTNQQVLVQMVSRIKVMFIGALVQTVHQVIKTPLPINGVKEYFSLEVWIFEIFYIYMQNYTTQTLVESWTSHLVYLKTVLP